MQLLGGGKGKGKVGGGEHHHSASLARPTWMSLAWGKLRECAIACHLTPPGVWSLPAPWPFLLHSSAFSWNVERATKDKGYRGKHCNSKLAPPPESCTLVKLPEACNLHLATIVGALLAAADATQITVCSP